MIDVTFDASVRGSGADNPRPPAARRPSTWTALITMALPVSLVASVLIAHAATENASPRPMAGIICDALVTFASLLAALRLATDAHAAYQALSRAHEDLQRRGGRVNLHRDLASVLAHIEAARYAIGPTDAGDDSAAGHRANEYLSEARESTLHLLRDLRAP